MVIMKIIIYISRGILRKKKNNNEKISCNTHNKVKIILFIKLVKLSDREKVNIVFASTMEKKE